MTKLPSESWYGVMQGVSTLETQLRYTSQAPCQKVTLYGRLLRALRAMPYAALERDHQAGRFWFRAAVMLVLLGIIASSEFLLVAGLSVLLFVGVGWLWDRLSLLGLRYRRRFDVVGAPALGPARETRAFLGESVTLTLEVRNRKPVPLMAVAVDDIFPVDLPLAEAQVDYNRATNRGAFRSFWMPGAFQRLTRRYTVTCAKRGYHFFGPAKLTTGDGAGLFSRTVTLKDAQCLVVYPRLYSVAEMRLPAKNPFGERVSKQRLFEDPLRTAGIRDWQPGDGLRRIHWRATARQQQMLSRVYEPSEEPQVILFLNVATLERYWEGVIPELAERTISVAGSLAAMCVEQRLPVGLVANAYWPGSDQTMRLLPGRSPDQLTHILEMLAAIDLPNRAIEAQLLREAPKLPWGATLVVVTAVAHEALLDALLRLAHARRKLVLFTLAEVPPERLLSDIRVYHLPHLVEDVIVPAPVFGEAG